jgi:hypothetical protein
MKPDSARIVTRHGRKMIDQDAEVEWYSGSTLYAHPNRIKINDVWEEVFTYEKSIREDELSGAREIVFHCHIGDNRIIEVVIAHS